MVCEKRGACVRRCLGEHQLLHHADLQTGTIVDLEEAMCWQVEDMGERVTEKCR